MRTFIAVELAPDVKRPLVKLLHSLPASRDVRWCSEDQLHVTLKFLGEISDDQLARVCAAASQAGAAIAPFTVHVDGLGVFPAPRNPRVLWCGLEDPDEGCRRWVEAIDPLLEPLDIKPETRRYTPHITLGRSRSSAGARVLRDVLETTPVPQTSPFTVDQVIVFESRLSPQGARYIALATVPLGGQI